MTHNDVTETECRSLADELDAMDQMSLDDLGALHVAIQEGLERVRDALAVAMRRARERGMPMLELTQRSGYKSQVTVIKIVNPAYREDQKRKARDRAAIGIKARQGG